MGVNGDLGIYINAEINPQSLNKIRSQIDQINKDIGGSGKPTQDATKNMHSFGESVVTAAKKFAVWSGVTVAYYGAIRAIANGIRTVKDLDTAMVDLRKVTNATEQQYEQFADTAFAVGRQLGRTGEEVIQAAATWARMGHSMEETMGLSNWSIILTNVADDIDNVNDSASGLIATMRGFNLEASDAEKIVDSLNEVSNKYAVTVGDLLTGISKEAATLSQANNSLDQSLGLITGGTEVMRDPARVATGLRTIALRLRGVDEEGNILAGNIPKLQSAFDKFGISLTDANGDFRSTYDILGDLAGVYQGMSDLDLANISELVSGKRQSTVLNAVLSNWERVEKAMQTSIDSAGSAAEENAKYLDSIEGRMKKFESAVQDMWRNTISTDTVKDVVDLGTKLIDLVDKVGLLNAAIIALQTTMLLTKKENFVQSIFAPLSGVFTKLTAKITTTDAAAKALASTMTALAGVAIVGGIMLAIKALDDAKHRMRNIADDVEESFRQMEENQNKLSDYAREYETLAKKTSLTSDEKIRLLTIERELKTEFGETASQIDLQNGALETNLELIQKLNKEQAARFVALNKRDYQEAMDYLNTGQMITLYSDNPYEKYPGESGVRAYFETAEEAAKAAMDNVYALSEANNERIYKLAKKQAEDLFSELDEATATREKFEAMQDILNGIVDTAEEMPEGVGLPTPKTIETLTSEFGALTDEVNSLYKSLNELNENGVLAPDTLNILVERYPEVIQYLHDHAQLQGFLTSKIEEYETTQLKTYQDILAKSEYYFTTLLDGYENFYNQLAAAYGADAENFKSLAEVKARTDEFLIEHLGTEWAKYYGTQEEALKSMQEQYESQLRVFKAAGMYSQYQQAKYMLDAVNKQLAVVGTISKAFDNLNLDFTPLNTSGVGSSGSENTIIDAIEDLINSQIDALQDKIDAEQRIIDQLNEQYDKEKALAKIEQLRLDIVKKREELANIKKEKNVRLYNAATGQFEWVADPREVERAEGELSNLQEDYAEARRDYQHDMEVKKHQDMIDSYNKQIDSLRDYLDTMEELTKKSVDEQLAEWNRLNGGNGSKGGSSSSGTQNNQSQINKLQDELRALWLRYNELKNSGYTKRTEAYNAYLRKREEIARLGGIPAYEKGGKVPNTGPALLHKGEFVLNKPSTDLLEHSILPIFSDIARIFRNGSGSINTSSSGPNFNNCEFTIPANNPDDLFRGLDAIASTRRNG